MALEIIKIDPSKVSGKQVLMSQRLWLNKDRSAVVADGDPRAAFLFCAPGQYVSEADARKYGLIAVVDATTDNNKPEGTKPPATGTKPSAPAGTKPGKVEKKGDKTEKKGGQ